MVSLSDEKRTIVT